MPILAGLISFAVAFLVLRHGWSNGILFYQGIASSMLGGGVTLGISAFSKRFTTSQIVKDSLLVFLASYAFMFTVPTTVERSYTVRLLEELDVRGSMSDADALEWMNQHWSSDDGLRKRLTEQSASGSITRIGGRISLTPRGRMLVRAFRTTSTWLAVGRSAP